MLIQCKDASFGYENQIYLSHVNFTLEEGDYLCVLGENGSGKSTLVKGLLGLIHPYEGSVVFGDSIVGKSIGYLPQKTNTQKDFPATVQEVVMSGCLSKKGLLPFWNKSDRILARNQMDRMKILDLAKESFRDLSGGQQQRVLIARALCATENLLFLDEPATGLDPSVTHELYELLHMLNREHHTAVLMVTHDIPNALRDASKVMQLEREMVFFGSKEEYLESEAGKSFLNYAREDKVWDCTDTGENLKKAGKVKNKKWN